MFSDEPKRNLHLGKIALVGFLILIGVIVYINNRSQPPAETVKAVATPVPPIINEEFELAPGEQKTFAFDTKFKKKMLGEYRTANKERISSSLMTKENFDKFKAGEAHTSIVTIPSLPAGRIDREMAFGEYVMVFTNDSKDQKPVLVNAVFNYVD